MAEALDRVLACVEARRGDAVELLQELVRINSVNPEFAGVRREDVIGGETRANEILRERYEQAGLETHWVAPELSVWHFHGTTVVSWTQPRKAWS